MPFVFQRASSLVFASLALSLSLHFAAPVWALDVQQAVSQQQLEPVYEWAQSATPAELRNLRVSWLQTLSHEMPDAESGILQTRSRFGGSLLHWAAYTGHNKLLDLLLDKGLEPDFPDAVTGTPLIVAARSGQLESVRRLVARGAKTEQWLGLERGDALKGALRQGHVEVARWLAAQTSSVPLCEQAQGLFIHSVRGERLEMVRYLHEQGCGAQERSEDGFTPLMLAAGRGNLPLFQLLLAQGHDPRAQAPNGTTALMLAAQGGQAEIVATLLAAGQAVRATNAAGEDALQYALAYGHLPIVKTLLAGGASLKANTPQGEAYLLAALHGGDLDVLRFVLSQGFAPTDLSAAQYQEVFSHAAYWGHTELLTYLLAQGVDPHRPDEEGMTPLLWAVRMGHLEAVKLLLAAGVNPNGLTDHTPLMEAAVMGRSEITRTLLAAGAHPQIKNAEGKSALSYACQDTSVAGPDRLAVVQQLLAQGAQPQDADASGSPPLLYAAKEGTLEVVQHLVAQGASLHVRDAEGHTALSYALSRRHLAVVTFLLDQGARPQELLPEYQFELLRLLAGTGDLTRVRSLLERLPAIAQQPETLFEIATGFAEQGHIEGVRFFLQRGVSVQASNEQATSLLSAAATSGRIELAQFLLSQGAWRAAPEDVKRRAVLAAAESGHPDMLALLLAQEPAQLRPYQALALSQAAGAGQAQLVKRLLEQGAEPDFTQLSPPLEERSPLLAAVEGGHLAATQALLAHRSSADDLAMALKTAVEARNLPLVQSLLDHDAPVDREIDNAPFIFWLVQQGYLDVLQRIPRQKWPSALPDGTDLLMQAAQKSHFETVAYLLEQGFAATARTRDGQSILMLTHSPEIMRLLVAKGAQVNLRQPDGGTALMRAASHANPEGVQVLLELGAEVNARKQDGTTALIAAVRSEDIFAANPHTSAAEISAVVEALLAKGADPKLRDKAGKTALDYARSNHLPEVVERLTQARR